LGIFNVGIWKELLDTYSNEYKKYRISLSAPEPYDILDPLGISMEFIPGTRVKAIESSRRNQTSIYGGRVRTLYAASLFAGALSKVKEEENLLHGDYKLRHLIFSPKAPTLYVIDLERSRREGKCVVEKETKKLLEYLKRKDPNLQDDTERYFERGYDLINHGLNILGDVVYETEKGVEQKFGKPVKININDYRLNDIYLL
jgi:hypothetical protein